MISNTIYNDALKESQGALKDEQTRDRVVVFIALGGDLAKLELYEYIVEITGIRPIVVEKEQNLLASTLQDRFKDRLIRISMSLDSRPSLVEDVVGEIRKKMTTSHIKRIDAVHTYWDDAVGLAARVASHFEVPTNPIKSIDTAHDKARSRKVLAQMGFPSPRSHVITSDEDLNSLTNQQTPRLRYPVILKPVYGAASIGVMKVDKEEDLIRTYREVISILTHCYSENDLMGLLFDAADVSSTQVTEGSALLHVVVEEFLQGREYDCDVVLDGQGESVWCELCDDWDYEPPHFVELGSSVPTTSSEDRETVVKEYTKRVIKALALTSGVHHVEIIDDESLGPVLVECNPRMGGGPVRNNHLIVHRVDIAIASLYSSLGLVWTPQPSDKIRSYSNATACLYADKGGFLQRPSQAILDEVIQPYLRNVVVATSCAEAGVELRGWGISGSHPSSLGLLTVSVEGTVQEAKDLVNALRKDFLERINADLATDH